MSHFLKVNNNTEGRNRTYDQDKIMRYRMGSGKRYLYKPVVDRNENVSNRMELYNSSLLKKAQNRLNHSAVNPIILKNERNLKVTKAESKNIGPRKLDLDKINPPEQQIYYPDIQIRELKTTIKKVGRKRLKFNQTFLSQERVNRKMYALSKTKNLTITCPELDNVTFTNDPPFDILGIPQCAETVKPKFK